MSEKCKNYVLVADDNHLINDVNKNIVEICFKKLNIDIEIILCYDGIDLVRNALNENINYNIKMIITDENMEFLNGSDAVEFLRKLESKFYLRKIPCISVTSHEDKVIIDNILSSGMNFVLSKPLTVSALFDILRHLNFN